VTSEEENSWWVVDLGVAMTVKFLLFTNHNPGKCTFVALCPIHTADADAMQLSSWVASGSVVCIGLYCCRDPNNSLRKNLILLETSIPAGLYFPADSISLDVKPCFLGEPCIGVPTKFFCSSDIFEGCWSRIRMMPPWHPWAFWIICKLRRPLPKFHFLAIATYRHEIKAWKWCLHLGFQGLRSWLDHCRNGQTICICINMQIRGLLCH